MSPSGEELSPGQWDDPSMRCFCMLIDGRAQATGIRRPAADATLLIAMNAHHDVVDVKLPEIAGNQQWTCLIAANMPVRDELPEYDSGDTYQITGRSLVLFALHARGSTQRVFDRLAENLVEDLTSEK